MPSSFDLEQITVRGMLEAASRQRQRVKTPGADAPRTEAPTSTGAKPIVVPWASEHWVNLYSRLTLPVEWMHKQSLVERVDAPYMPDEAIQELSARGGAVVMQSNTNPWRLDRIARLKREGILVVADEDDDMRAVYRSDRMAQRSQYETIAGATVTALFKNRDEIQSRMAKGVDYIDLAIGAQEDAGTKQIVQAWVDIALASETVSDARARLGAIAPWIISPRTIKHVDLVTVSTDELGAALEDLNPHIEVLPTCIDLSLPCYKDNVRQLPHEGIIIGWAGTYLHKRDLAGLKDVMAEIMAEYDGTGGRPLVRLMIGGASPMLRAFENLPGMPEFAGRIERQFGDRENAQGFETVVSDCGRYIFRSWTRDILSVPGMYADVDIGIIPNHLDEALNRSKTDIKGLEMAGMGIPCVVSPIPAYKRHRPEGTGAILIKENYANLWVDALRRLIEDENLRRRLSEEARAYVETRSIEVRGHLWLEAYERAARRTGKLWPAEGMKESRNAG